MSRAYKNKDKTTHNKKSRDRSNVNTTSLNNIPRAVVANNSHAENSIENQNNNEYKAITFGGNEEENSAGQSLTVSDEEISGGSDEKVSPSCLAKPYTEDTNESPVFEAHVRTLDLGKHFTYKSHAFIGLRFTEYNPCNRMYVRKYFRIGYGGNIKSKKTRFPYEVQKLDSKLTDDTNQKTMIGFQGKITYEQVKEAINNIRNYFKKYPKYQFFTRNCRIFVKEMAKKLKINNISKMFSSVSPVGAANKIFKNLYKRKYEELNFLALDDNNINYDKFKDDAYSYLNDEKFNKKLENKVNKQKSKIYKKFKKDPNFKKYLKTRNIKTKKDIDRILGDYLIISGKDNDIERELDSFKETFIERYENKTKIKPIKEKISKIQELIYKCKALNEDSNQVYNKIELCDLIIKECQLVKSEIGKKYPYLSLYLVKVINKFKKEILLTQDITSFSVPDSDASLQEESSLSDDFLDRDRYLPQNDNAWLEDWL